LVLRQELSDSLKARGLPTAEHCIVVSIDQQKLWFFGGETARGYVVSTARAGVGCVADSLQTPLGLHRVAEKIGADAPPGMVFKARVPTGRIWTEGPAPEDNLITTRILMARRTRARKERRTRRGWPAGRYESPLRLHPRHQPGGTSRHAQ